MTNAATDQRDDTGRQPDVSVLIITWNSAPWIARCLDSLPAAVGSLDWETIVVDNASTDATLARVEQSATKLELVRHEENRGFAAAVNVALERAGGRYLLLLNPDSVPDPGSLESLCRYLDDHPDHGGAAPLLIGEDGLPQAAFQLRKLPDLRTLLAEILLLNRLFPRNRLQAHHPYSSIDFDGQAVEIEQPAAAALMLRAGVVERTGRFDEQFHPAWFEDVDYCRRLAERGERLVLLPWARVKHRGAASLDTMGLAAFLPIWYRNLYLYANKWMSPVASQMIRWMVIVGMLLRIGALAVGLNTMPIGREEALAAHRRVLGEAFRGWRTSS